METFDFVNRANAEYIDQLFQQYQKDPRSVDTKWQAFFAGFSVGTAQAQSGQPQLADGKLTVGIYDLVHSYRELGHFIARLDPLGHDRPGHPLLELSEFGLNVSDLDRRVVSGSFLGTTSGTLRDLIEKLRATYCRTIGVEYMDIPDKAQREWLQQRMEPINNSPQLTPAETKGILFQMIAGEELEMFLHRRYVGQKRFSLEGGISLIPMLNTLIDDGGQLGVEEFVLGMAHRGRLNVLTHVLNKPYEILLSEFEGTIVSSDYEGDGDVKYHLGYSNVRPTAQGKQMHLLLCPNPSHLELVNPVIEGIVRSKQTYLGDKNRNRIVPVLLHGEAAFTGQGIVPETLGLSELPGFRTGGTIHIIINNQIGFTAGPKQTRFTPYPTDVAKMIQAPIFHVNGDDPEACVHAAKLAIAFREQFKVDVMIDLWCYRLHGHNETDEPTFTQPVMYKQIESHESARKRYTKRLLDEGRITQQEVDDMHKVVQNRLTSAAEQAKEYRPRVRNISLGAAWKGMARAGGDWTAKTTVQRDVLANIVQKATTVPEDFTVNPKLNRLLTSRQQMLATGKGIDWGCAEMLAMGSLLLEGHWVRMMGQDVERGTFSHRHVILYDFNNGKRYVPLAHLSPDQGHITIANTMLSELAVLGFEYGFTLADPRPLVIWEAQFGDFINGAQGIIDQFIVAAESKWQLMSGLVINLPHGYEGQGPEHSNAYIERFLSMCAEDNIQVCIPTTSAQYFHVLRRQIHRKFRKPLILMMPKGLLRYEPATSRIEEFTDQAFQLVIDEPASTTIDPQRVRRLLICTGKVFYTLAAAREKEKIDDVAIVRVEQLYPFPKKELQALLVKYRAASEIAWVQEEPQNRGAWTFMEKRLRDMLPETAVLSYYGREEAASPATGSYKMHQVEEQEFVAQALDLAGRQQARIPQPTVAPSPTAVSQ